MHARERFIWNASFTALRQFQPFSRQFGEDASMSQKAPELPILSFESQHALESWLRMHHLTERGFWLQFAKKGSGIASVSYNEAVETALCFGWIDSQAKSYDEKTWIQRFTPRGKRSIWSKVNQEKTALLIAAGRMQEAGFQAIETAKQNGNWDNAYAPQSAATPPDDFAAALEQSAKAKAFFDTLNAQNKFAMLFRLQNTKKRETREKKILQFIAMLERGEKIYP
jgi:uncharacterized protein YdeI (YjbR/CyaY-like superfamily)